MPHYLISVLADTDTNRCFHKLHFHLIQFLQFCDFADFLYSGFRENYLHYLEKARVIDPFGHAGLTPLGEIRMTLAGEIKMTPVGILRR